MALRRKIFWKLQNRVMTFILLPAILIALVWVLATNSNNRAKPNLEIFRIVVFGDFGKGNPEQYAVGAAMGKYCQSKICDLAITTGDNFYPAGVSSVDDPKWKTHFEDPYASFDFLVYATVGNHDYDGSLQAQIDYSAKSKKWRFPALTYFVPNLPENLSIYISDTIQFTGNQVKDIKSNLCKKNGWKMIFGHFPIYSTGRHGGSAQLTAELLPVIKECGIDTYVSGHDHDQEFFSDGDTDFVVQGAGADTRPFPNAEKKENGNRKFGSTEPGFTIFEISEQKIHIEFYNTALTKIFEFDRLKSWHKD